MEPDDFDFSGDTRNVKGKCGQRKMNVGDIGRTYNFKAMEKIKFAKEQRALNAGMLEKNSKNDTNEFDQGELDRATELWLKRNKAKKMKMKGNDFPDNSDEDVKLDNGFKKNGKMKKKH